MTLDEQHDYLILEKLLPTKGTRLSREQYTALTKDITGNSSDYIKASLLQKGYLEDGNNFIDEQREFLSSGQYNTVYRIFLTDIGEKAYYDLKKKKHNELIQTIAFWILFAAAIISAAYAVATYYAGGETKNQQSATPMLSPMPAIIDTNKQLQQLDQHDTTIPKKNVSSFVDTAKAKTKTK